MHFINSTLLFVSETDKSSFPAFENESSATASEAKGKNTGVRVVVYAHQQVIYIITYRVDGS